MEVGGLHDPPDVSDGDQGTDQDEDRHRPPAALDGGEHQVPLADESRRQGHPDQAQPAEDDGRRGQRHAPAHAPQVIQLAGAEAGHHAAHGEEQGALGHGVVEEVHQGRRQPRGRAQPDADDHVADLGDARPGEEALEVLLEEGHQGGDEDPRQPQTDEQRVHAEGPEGEGGAEDPVVEPQEDVDRDLGRRRREQGGHRRGGIGIGVRQPQVQGEEGQLEADPHGEEGEGGQHRARVHHRLQTLGEIDHVQGARHHVEQADADDEEGRPHRPHDEVLEGGAQGAPVPSEGDEGIAGEGGDLQEDEEVEDVPGDRHPHQPREAEQVGAVEQAAPDVVQLGGEAARRVEQDHGADEGHQQEDEGVDRVDAVLDAPGRLPAAESVDDDAFRQGPVEQQGGEAEGRPADDQGEGPSSSRRRRRRTQTGAAARGTTICRTGRCSERVTRRRRRGSRPPPPCRRPPGCGR